jgi:hypothetical protein
MVTTAHDATASVRVALIGSFRRHFDVILDVRNWCEGVGLTVTTPAGSDVLDASVAFVRLDCDDAALDDSAVQAVATHRILAADAVYVVAPGGYVGRTTCYEVGRALEAGRPVYFSEAPHDLPISVPATHIMTGMAFATTVAAGLHHWWNPDTSEATLFGTDLTIGTGGR